MLLGVYTLGCSKSYSAFFVAWISDSTAPFEKSGIRLVTDLQRCIKAQQSKAYARKVKHSNLQNITKTLFYVQEHGYDTVEAAEGRLAEIKELASFSRKELKDIKGRIRQVNEQIHYTGQYLATKSIYSLFLKAKNKGQFRHKHSPELALYKAAVKFLKEKSGGGKIPNLQTLKSEKEQLRSALGRSQSRPAHKREHKDIS